MFAPGFGTVSASMDGAADYFTRTSVDGDDIGAGGAITISYWIKSNSETSYQDIFNFNGGSSTGDDIRPLYKNNDTQEIYYDRGPGTAHHSNFENWVVASNWEFHCWVLGGSEHIFYRDAVDKSVGTWPFDGGGHGNLNTGLTSTIKVFNKIDGLVMNMALHGVALNSSNISALYNSGVPLDNRTNSGGYNQAANLISYWLLGAEGDDFTVSDGVIDRGNAGLNLHLTAQGAPTTSTDVPS